MSNTVSVEHQAAASTSRSRTPTETEKTKDAYSEILITTPGGGGGKPNKPRESANTWTKKKRRTYGRSPGGCCVEKKEGFRGGDKGRGRPGEGGAVSSALGCKIGKHFAWLLFYSPVSFFEGILPSKVTQ